MSRRQEIRLRREKVKVMLGLGLSGLEMSKQLGVDSKTIYRDIKEIRKEWGREIRNINLDEFIGSIWADCQRRKKEYQRIFQSTKSEQVKISCLKAQAEEDERIVKVLQSVGKLHKEPERYEHTLEFSFGN